MWDFIFGSPSNVIINTAVGGIALTVIMLIIAGLVAKVKNPDYQIIKMINGIAVGLQLVLGSLIGLRFGALGGYHALGGTEGALLYGSCIGGPIGLVFGGVVGALIGVVCVRIATITVNWIAIDIA